MTSPGALAEKLTLWREAVNLKLTEHGFRVTPDYLNAPARYALGAPGKRLRPALCLATAEGVSGSWEPALSAATALEIFHTFTLVHDDVMDGDEMRRGQPTVHKKFDANQALLAGDALMIHAYQLLAEVNAERLPRTLNMFNQGALDVCRGQAWDMEFETTATVDLAAYGKMIDLKTGALLRLACGLGAYLAGATDLQTGSLEKFGLLLGRAFQLQDDLLEVTSTTDIMGKSLGSDLINKKKTWLWLDLHAQMSSDQQLAWETLLNSDLDLEHKRAEMQNWMQRTGTLDRAGHQIKTWMHAAHKLLESADLQHPESLELLAGLILDRRK